jgi:hypothetical protein
MDKVLRWVSWTAGIACVLIGFYHFVGGVASVPGEGAASATVDSRERFYAAIFLGYGVAWVWAARRAQPAVSVVAWLSAVMLVGGLGRVLSMLIYGLPHWFQVVLTVVELVVPVAVLARCRSVRRRPVGTLAQA